MSKIKFAAPAVPSTGSTEGWYVRRVISGSHTAPTCLRRWTRSEVYVDCLSFNDLLETINDLGEEYGVRPRSNKIGDSAYRWTFVEDLPGHRVSEMIIASKIG